MPKMQRRSTDRRKFERKPPTAFCWAVGLLRGLDLSSTQKGYSLARGTLQGNPVLTLIAFGKTADLLLSLEHQYIMISGEMQSTQGHSGAIEVIVRNVVALEDLGVQSASAVYLDDEEEEEELPRPRPRTMHNARRKARRLNPRDDDEEETVEYYDDDDDSDTEEGNHKANDVFEDDSDVSEEESW